MSVFFAEKIKLLKEKCFCKILESLKGLALSFKNKLISSRTSSDREKFHNEKSYPT